jgi:ectoine hydroxylase-related dioxygenase (phytanoyl-CoA dioxygenase family)
MPLKIYNMEKQQLHEEGYVVYRQFFDPEIIHDLRKQAQSIFQIQFDRFGYKGEFKENIIQLFNEHFDIFSNCGKQIQQGLIPLYQLAFNDKLINKLKELGIEFPNVCTRPVLFFNHPKLAKEQQYYKTPLHQDWPSMQSSMDSVVVWIPLMDVTPENGAVIFYPKTHKLGPLVDKLNGGFAEIIVENTNVDLSQYPSIQPNMNAGDIVIFSTLLLHESGDIENDSIRWSCHFRYTNMLEQDYIERGFPHPYIYKSII